MRPPVFEDLEFGTALRRAVAESRLLLVDATATWCGPCMLMERTTWVDREVVAWLDDRAIVIQVDVDSQKEVARELHIESVPTIVVFVEGAEFDRVIGAQRPKELIEWLKSIVSGQTMLALLENSARAEPTNVRTRLNLASALAQARRHDAALSQYIWLWEHMLEYEPALYGVRLSFLATELEMLANAYAPAHAMISELRERVAPPVSGPIDRTKFHDWVCLNRVLSQNERTLDWYDSMPSQRRSDLGPHLAHFIIPHLVDAGRWAEAGALYDDPLATLGRAAHILSRSTDPTCPPEFIESLRMHFRSEVAKLVRALSAAQRCKDVDVVTMQAREIDPSDEMQQALEEVRKP